MKKYIPDFFILIGVGIVGYQFLKPDAVMQYPGTMFANLVQPGFDQWPALCGILLIIEGGLTLIKKL